MELDVGGQTDQPLIDSLWLRVVVGLICLMGAALAARDAATPILVARGDASAFAFDPTSVAAAAMRAGQLIEREPERIAQDPALRDDLTSRAREGLRREPIDAAPLRTLAFVAALQGNEERAERLLSLAERITRRDLLTQLALIEVCVSKSRIDCALQHYATALATHDEADNLLLPRLASALSVPGIRQGLLPYLRSAPIWVRRFLSYAAANATDAAPIADAIIGAQPLRTDAELEEVIDRIAVRLADAKQFDRARQLYLTRTGSRTADLADLSFEPRLTDGRRQPIHWSTFVDEAASAGFAGQRKRTLEVSVQGRRPTLLARRYLYLSVGRYTFDQRVTPPPGASGFEWNLRCADDTSILLLTTGVRPGRDTFAVTNCRNVWIELVSTGTSSNQQLTIERVELNRIG